jgi:hypothetical protein
MYIFSLDTGFEHILLVLRLHFLIFIIVS